MTLERAEGGKGVQGGQGGQGGGQPGHGARGDPASRSGRPDERRSNPALAAVVDEAIRFDAERGAALAWAYLARHGLPPETILRVLAAPAAGQRPRRASSAPRDGAGIRL